MKYRIDYERRSGEDVYEETDHDIEADSAGEALADFIAELNGACDLDWLADDALQLESHRDFKGTVRELATAFANDELPEATSLDFWLGDDAIYSIVSVRAEDERECSRCHGKGRLKLEAAMSVRDALDHIIDCLDSGGEQSRAFAEEIKIGREALASTWAEQEPCGCCSTCSCGKS